MPHTTPLPGAGCLIEDVDLGGPVDGATFAAIERALHRHLFVVLRGQTLTPSAFLAFARHFGRPEPHVIDQYHHPWEPDVLILSNVVREGRNIGLADGGTYFHTDYSYLEVPARCTLLHAVAVPPDSGTTFADQRRAYAELPADTKARIDGLVCHHHYGNRDNLDESSRTAASRLNDEQKDRMNWVRHPLVRRHPHTGEKSLYAVSGSSFGIEGMGNNEGRALLDDLCRHATQEKYRTTYDYRVGDVMIWDNCALLHSAPLVDAEKYRTLWRITVKEAGPTL